MDKGIQIGGVAEQTGLTVDAIRFYERSRLLPTAPRSTGGFRLFRKQDVEELRFIRKAQELGFSLDEIRELISLRKGSPTPCARMEQLLNKKLYVVRAKLKALQTLESELNRDLRACRIALRRTAQRNNCPVLDEIGRNGKSARRQK